MIPLSAASNERRITVGWQAIARASSVFKDKCANHSKKNLRSVHLTDSHIWIRNVESHNEANVTITVNAARTLKNYASSQLERRKNSKADTWANQPAWHPRDKELKWNWAGHVSRTNWTTHISCWPPQGHTGDGRNAAGEMTSTSFKSIGTGKLETELRGKKMEKTCVQ